MKVRKLLAVAVLAACGRTELGPPEYPLANCYVSELIDANTAKPIIGVEDISLVAGSSNIWISAYDRIASEAAGSRDAVSGGFYEFPLDVLANGRTEIRSAVSGGGEFVNLPHGFSTGPSSKSLISVVFIDRHIAGSGAIEASLRVADLSKGDAEYFLDGDNDLRTSPAPRNSNDVLLVSSDSVLFTVDRIGPNWVSDVFGRATGQLVRADYDEDAKAFLYSTLTDGLFFANGLIDVEDVVVVAETRGERLALIDADTGEITRRFPLPGGPDNLTRAPGGSILAAVHPSLLKLGMHRRFGAEHAPSRAVRVDPETGAWSLLFDDPTGKVFTGATVAAEIDGKLVLGSATDRGLLVCEKP